MVIRKYYPELEGTNVYPWWKLHKNISWHNVTTWPMGLVYGLITLEWIRKPKDFIVRIKPWEVWMPPVYAKNYYKELD